MEKEIVIAYIIDVNAVLKNKTHVPTAMGKSMNQFKIRTEVIGMVEIKTVARGSKSERQTAVVHTDEGDSLILRRLGSNSLRLDKDFVKLDGRRIKFNGKQMRQFFFTTAWHNAEGT